MPEAQGIGPKLTTETGKAPRAGHGGDPHATGAHSQRGRLAETDPLGINAALNIRTSAVETVDRSQTNKR